MFSLKEIFFNDVGNFQWGSVTAIGALLAFLASVGSIIVTLSISKKNRRAELVSKARLEWIKEVRHLTAELLSDVFQCKERTKSLEDFGKKSRNSETEKDKEKFKELAGKEYEEFNRLAGKIKYEAIKMKIYFTPGNDKHGEIVALINKVSSISLYKDTGKYSSAAEMIEKTYEDIDPLATMISEYLKQEWEKAKKGM